MMNMPEIAGTSPAEVELEEGRRYFFCTCGRSEKQPFCDGAHKGSEFSPFVFSAEKAGKAYLCLCKRTKGTPFCDGSHNKLDEA
jgi:CDGSH-type Zn-finger protein